MTIWVPGWMQGGTYVAQQDRINSRAADWDEGVDSRADLKVSQRAAGANMSVDVAVGACVITGDDQVNQGNYDVFNDAIFNLTGFTAPVSNSRYDIVGMQLNDPNAGGAAGSNAVITRVVGTAAASPVIPTIPLSFLPLAIVGPILTSTTSIPNSMIHDAHTGTGPTGVTGVRLCKGLRDTPGVTKETYNPVAPNGWLIEAGQAISRTTYARLFEHLGTTFGAGDGSSTFNLPDSRGRVAVALDNQGGVDAGRLAAANALGGAGGEELHILTLAELAAHAHTGVTATESVGHTHTIDPPNTTVAVTDPGHAHVDGVGNPPTASGAFNAGSTYPQVRAGFSTATATTGITAAVDIAPFASGLELATHTHAITSEGSGTAHNNMQPYILLYRTIRT